MGHEQAKPGTPSTQQSSDQTGRRDPNDQKDAAMGNERTSASQPKNDRKPSDRPGTDTANKERKGTESNLDADDGCGCDGKASSKSRTSAGRDGDQGDGSNE